MLSISNHAPSTWSPAQQEAVRLQGVTDVFHHRFPEIDPDIDTPDLERQIHIWVAQLEHVHDAVMALVAGEQVALTILVKELQARGIRCVSGTSKRIVEQTGPDTKHVRFEFVRLRDFPPLGPG